MAATAEDELKSFSNPSTPGMGKSYSYYVAKDGRVWSLAPPDRVAYHAGTSSWNKDAAARRKVTWPTEEGDAQFAALNIMSIGIGMESHNTEGEVYPEAQLHACATLCRDLMQRYRIPKHRVLTHYMVSAPRKTDPVNFDLAQFYKRLEEVKPPLLVVDAPEPVVHEGDFGSDILLRIRGKELKVDARFGIPNDLKPGDLVPVPSGLNKAERVEFSRLLNEKVNEVLTPPPAVKVVPQYGSGMAKTNAKEYFKEVEVPMPIPAREAIAISAKAQRATEADPQYKLDDQEPIVKQIMVIAPLFTIALTGLVTTGAVAWTDVQVDAWAYLFALIAVLCGWLANIIMGAIARRRTYSEATVGQLLADQKELLKSDSVR
jgi:hypothetical protein